jgi:hypothetical protein
LYIRNNLPVVPKQNVPRDDHPPPQEKRRKERRRRKGIVILFVGEMTIPTSQWQLLYTQ